MPSAIQMGSSGVNFSVNDVRPDAHLNADTPLHMLTRHFHYLSDRIGIDRVAIGSDFDGATIPAAIKDASGLPNLIAALRASGFDGESIRKIAVRQLDACSPSHLEAVKPRRRSSAMRAARSILFDGLTDIVDGSVGVPRHAFRIACNERCCGSLVNQSR